MIAASADLHNQDIQLIFEFDKLDVNRLLGFKNKELITAGVISVQIQDKPIRALRLRVSFVWGTHYFEADQFIQYRYQATTLQQSPVQPLQHLQFNFDRDKFYPIVWNRR